MSLATVDRETSERYVETQEQAIKLIEIYKGQGDAFNHAYLPLNRDMRAAQHRLPLSHLGRPSFFSRALTLVRCGLVFVFIWNSAFVPFRRTWRLYASPYMGPLLIRFLTLPAFYVLLLLFYYGTPPHSVGAPLTRAGLVFNLLCVAALCAPFVCTFTGERL